MDRQRAPQLWRERALVTLCRGPCALTPVQPAACRPASLLMPTPNDWHVCMHVCYACDRGVLESEH